MRARWGPRGDVGTSQSGRPHTGKVNQSIHAFEH
jgi:hypothetical protein